MEFMVDQVDCEDNILIVGCGSSRLPIDMFWDGYENITCIDWCQNVINLQRDLNSEDNAFPIRFVKMDARDMSQFKDGSFDTVIDKAMIDAILTGDNGETVTQILSEVHRVLTPTGKFVCVSHGT